jgi:hypothetical protein
VVGAHGAGDRPACCWVRAATRSQHNDSGVAPGGREENVRGKVANWVSRFSPSAMIPAFLRSVDDLLHQSRCKGWEIVTGKGPSDDCHSALAAHG